MPRLTRAGRIREADDERLRALIQALGIKTSGMEQPSAASADNQQKSSWHGLATERGLLILAEPTRGRRRRQRDIRLSSANSPTRCGGADDLVEFEAVEGADRVVVLAMDRTLIPQSRLTEDACERHCPA